MGNQASQELRLATTKEKEFLHHFDYVAGLFVLYDNYNANLRSEYRSDAGAFFANAAQYKATSANALMASLNGINEFQIENPATTNIAGYGQTTWHATDRVDLTLGFRNSFPEPNKLDPKVLCGR